MSLAKYAYYYTLRLKARDVVANAMNQQGRRRGRNESWGNLTLASINQEAIDQARLEWPKHYSEETHNGFAYSWERLWHKFSSRPSFFDLAIWQQIGEVRVLQGMALGKPSNGKAHLTINWVERSFAPTYLKGGILIPVLACAEEYAKLLGCERVLVKDPVDPKKYERYGYRPYRLTKVPGTYLCKELSHDDDQG